MAGKKSQSPNDIAKPHTRKKHQNASPAAETTAAETEKAVTPHERARFPIVAIGASAGGLEALEQFFSHTSSDCGLAFVLVQHLDPTHKSILGQLLQHSTQMHVVEVADDMEVQPNCVYVIPPNRDMAILHGRLQLIEPSKPRGLRLPIDFFFRSLAQDQQERAIGIVLSGTGTDGTLGLKAIKEAGGMAMVQDLASAQFDGMPRSAIATGLVDFILPPDKMLEQLLVYTRQILSPGITKLAAPATTITDHFQKIVVLLRAQTGHDFSGYKQNTIIRRIERRMIVNQIDEIAHYVRYLQQNPVEVETLFKNLLIGVSNFFRDPDAFEVLKDKIIPALLKDRSLNNPVRIWVPACASGEEAYSIAILVQECMSALQQTAYKVQIFATDIDNEAIDAARAGRYPDTIAIDVSADRLQKFFCKEDDGYQIKKFIRERVVFAIQDLIKDPPFSNLDLISCRNLLIYLEAELQKKVLSIFHYALNSAGYLFLGSSESIGNTTDLFTPLDRKWRLFQRRKDGSPRRPGVGFPFSPLPPLVSAPRTQADQEIKHERNISLREFTERLLLEHYSPACVIVSNTYDLLYLHGRTGKYLEPATGEANLNILKMARKGLQLELISALREVVATQNDICRKGLRVDTNGETQVINLTIKPILEPPSLRGLIAILFEDSSSSERPEATPPTVSKESTGQVSALESELKSTREYLQATIEELETSVEELKSANEELQSANEELQSTNEELETSSEELQSVNEELVTVNAEHESKIQELSKTNNDFNNLLAGTQIGTLFLDDKLCIQRFTPAATRAVNLIATDVGRPLSHIASNLYYDRLVEDARDVLDTLSNKEKEVEAKGGRWYNMRILPYRTTENVIQGAVITFSDITEQKRAQERLRTLTRVIEQSTDMVAITDIEGNVEYVNSQFTDVTGYLPQEVHGSQYSLLRGENLSEQQQKQLRETVTAGREWRGEVNSKKKNGERYWESASISPLKDSNGRITHFVLVSEDITERRKIDRLATVVRDSNDAITLQDFEGKILAWNRGAEQMYGWREEEALAMNILDLVPEPEKEETLTLIKKIAQGESVKSLTTQRVTKDGKILDVWLTITTLTDAAGRPTAIATTERDVTRHKQAHGLQAVRANPAPPQE